MRCGTPAGCNGHKARGEKPCDACARAKAEYDRRWRSGTELEAVEALSSQIETGSDEVVLRRVDAIAIDTAIEIQTSYIALLEELLDRD